MTQPGPYRSPFEIAHQNMRQLLRHLRYQLQMPPDTIRLQVDGILASFLREEVYEQAQALRPKPEGP